MMLRRFAVFLAALWWGGISGLSFVAVPTLFASMGSPALAGPVAARLFSLQSWAGLGIGLLLLLILRSQYSRAPRTTAPAPGDARAMQLALGTMGFVLLAMVLALVQDFGIAQKIVMARAGGGNLRLWHGLGSLMVLGQWLCAGAVLWRLSRSS